MEHIDIVFDGPPAPESGRLVGVENSAGRSISFGEWVKRSDGYWVLRLTTRALSDAVHEMGMKAEHDRQMAKPFADRNFE